MKNSNDIKRELQDKTKVLKQLEGVYKTSTDIYQRKRVLKEIEEVKKEIAKLQLRNVAQKLKNGTEEQNHEREESIFPVLSQVKISKYREGSKDSEMDAIVSYANFFEGNYLHILSEYYIKLDYSHTAKRDSFYPRFMEIKKILKQYDYEHEVSTKREFDTISLHKNRSAIHKLRQRYLFSLDKFFKDIKTFLKVLVDDNRTEGNIVLNPLDSISLNEFEENRRLNGYVVIDALTEMYSFSEEFIKFLGMPEIKE